MKRSEHATRLTPRPRTHESSETPKRCTPHLSGHIHRRCLQSDWNTGVELALALRSQGDKPTQQQQQPPPTPTIWLPRTQGFFSNRHHVKNQRAGGRSGVGGEVNGSRFDRAPPPHAPSSTMQSRPPYPTTNAAQPQAHTPFSRQHQSHRPSPNHSRMRSGFIVSNRAHSLDVRRIFVLSCFAREHVPPGMSRMRDIPFGIVR